MNHAERVRRHHNSLDRINQVQMVVGRGDRSRIDHEGTLLERARMMLEEISSHQATESGLAALDRLLRVAEERHTAAAHDVADFIAAVWNNQSLSLATLRGVESRIGDDMVAVLDAFRYGRLNLAEHVEGGPALRGAGAGALEPGERVRAQPFSVFIPSMDFFASSMASASSCLLPQRGLPR